MECDADGRERVMEQRLKGTPPCCTSIDLPATRRVGRAALAEVVYGGAVAAYTLGGRFTQLHPFANAALLPGCRTRLGGRLDGARTIARYFDDGHATTDWAAPHEAAVAAADPRVRDRAWCGYLAGAIAHLGAEHPLLHQLLARAAAACGSLPLSCRLVHLCVQPTPGAARLLVETLPAAGHPLAHCAWVAAAALASDRRATLQQSVQWMTAMAMGAGTDAPRAACGALDLWLRLLEDADGTLRDDDWLGDHIDTVLACRAAPGAMWTAALGQCIRAHGLGDAVWPICIHTLLTGTLPPAARWRLGYPQQPLVLRVVERGAPLAVRVTAGGRRRAAVVGRVWAAAMGAQQCEDALQALLRAEYVAAVPLWWTAAAAAAHMGDALSPMRRALAHAAEQPPLAALHSLLACGRAMLHGVADAAEMQTPRVLVLVAQSLAHALSSNATAEQHGMVLGDVATRAAHALIHAVQLLPPLLPISAMQLVPEPWPLCPLQCPWMPLPSLDGLPLVLGLQQLLPLLPGQARVACLEHLADVSPLPGCVPELLFDAALAMQQGAQARAWAVPLVAGAAAASRPPSAGVMQGVVRLLDAEGLYTHAAAELRG